MKRSFLSLIFLFMVVFFFFNAYEFIRFLIDNILLLMGVSAISWFIYPVVVAYIFVTVEILFGKKEEE